MEQEFNLIGNSDVGIPPSKATMAAANRYPGGKNAPGIYQRLISLMPPHRVYIEMFLGSGAIIRRKRPALENIGIDLDPWAIAKHGDAAARSFKVICGDAREILRQRTWEGDELIYADPPYLGDSRAGGHRRIYRCEMLRADEHAELLDLLKSIPAMVMLSGYPSPLYDQALREWSREEYLSPTRRGMVAEVVWFNFERPSVLHDYRFLGADFHDRLRIQRKICRLRAKLAALPPLERAAVIDGINDGADGATL